MGRGMVWHALLRVHVKTCCCCVDADDACNPGGRTRNALVNVVVSVTWYTFIVCQFLFDVILKYI